MIWRERSVKNDLVICVGADVCNRSPGLAVVSVAGLCLN